MAKPYGKMNMGRHWLRQWLVAWRHQAITWTNVDFHMWGSLIGIRLRAISERVPKLLLFMMCENCSFLIYRYILMRQWVNCICPEEMHSCTRYTYVSRKWVTTVLRYFLVFAYWGIAICIKIHCHTLTTLMWICLSLRKSVDFFMCFRCRGNSRPLNQRRWCCVAKYMDTIPSFFWNLVFAGLYVSGLNNDLFVERGVVLHVLSDTWVWLGLCLQRRCVSRIRWKEILW